MSNPWLDRLNSYQTIRFGVDDYDDVANTIADATGGTHPLDVTNAEVRTATSHPGGEPAPNVPVWVRTNGTNQYGFWPAHADLEFDGEFTVVAWLRRHTALNFTNWSPAWAHQQEGRIALRQPGSSHYRLRFDVGGDATATPGDVLLSVPWMLTVARYAESGGTGTMQIWGRTEDDAAWQLLAENTRTAGSIGDGAGIRFTLGVNDNAGTLTQYYPCEITPPAVITEAVPVDDLDAIWDAAFAEAVDLPRHKVDLPQQWRTLFGLSYPVTHMLSLSGAGTPTTAQKLDGAAGTWETISPMPVGATNVEGWRVDGSIVYLTARWGANNDLHLRVLDAGDNPINTTYVGRSLYYDDRRMPVVVSWDDWDGEPGRHQDFLDCVAAQTAQGVVATCGLNPNGVGQLSDPTAIGSMQWADMQSLIDTGDLEVSNHGHTHANPNDAGYDAAVEIDDAVAAIRANLSLPEYAQYGGSDFVLGWIRPFGNTNSDIEGRLAQNGILNQREAFTSASNFDYSVLDETLEIFESQPPTTLFDSGDQATWDASFDQRYDNGALYHGYGHPYKAEFDWSDTFSDIYGHLAHIGNRDDVWYVGWGAFYAYRLAAITAQADPDPAPLPVFVGPFLRTTGGYLRTPNGILRPA